MLALLLTSCRATTTEGPSSGGDGTSGESGAECQFSERAPLGFAWSDATGFQEFQGTISELSDTSLTVMSAAGARVMTWQGPSLAESLPPGTEVEVRFVAARSACCPASQGWAVVRSRRFIAATLSEELRGGQSTQVGGAIGVAVPSGFPALRWLNGGCCSSGVYQTCDYGTLEARGGAAPVLIEKGSSAEVGGFTVTNFGASYIAGPELDASYAVSILGPAPAEP